MTTPADLVYHVGRNPVKFVLKKGKVVVSGGRIVRGDRADSSP